jgi:hypothetical protein
MCHKSRILIKPDSVCWVAIGLGSAATDLIAYHFTRCTTQVRVMRPLWERLGELQHKLETSAAAGMWEPLPMTAVHWIRLGWIWDRSMDGAFRRRHAQARVALARDALVAEPGLLLARIDRPTISILLRSKLAGKNRSASLMNDPRDQP